MTDAPEPTSDGSPLGDLLVQLALMIRAMPVNERAESIVNIFRMISAEFAVMVLENVEPRDKPKPH